MLKLIRTWYIQQRPTAIVSLGDSLIDFPMHQAADIAFHVGGELDETPPNLIQDSSA